MKAVNSRRSRVSAFFFVLCVVLISLCTSIEAQQQEKQPRIGFLGATSAAVEKSRIEAFQQGLRELAYVEGKNIGIEYRWADGKLDRLPELAAELVRLKVDIIVSGGSTSSRAAKEATITIPIVMAQVNDPVGSRMVASLAHPGGNITGLSTLVPELSGKRLELLKEIIPKLSHVALFGTSNTPGNAEALRETELAAKAFKVSFQYLDIRDPKDVETAFRAATNNRVDAVLVPGNPVLIVRRKQIAELAIKNRLPIAYGQPEYVEEGGLMSYGTSVNNL